MAAFAGRTIYTTIVQEDRQQIKLLSAALAGHISCMMRWCNMFGGVECEAQDTDATDGCGTMGVRGARTGRMC